MTWSLFFRLLLERIIYQLKIMVYALVPIGLAFLVLKSEILPNWVAIVPLLLSLGVVAEEINGIIEHGYDEWRQIK